MGPMGAARAVYFTVRPKYAMARSRGEERECLGIHLSMHADLHVLLWRESGLDVDNGNDLSRLWQCLRQRTGPQPSCNQLDGP